MNEQELRKLFTEIGCVMEDVRGTALVWHHDDSRSAADRAAELRRACDDSGFPSVSNHATQRFMDRPSILQRAFELAKSGEVTTVEKLVHRLSREGYPSVREHLTGRALRKQLSEIIKADRTTAESKARSPQIEG